MLKEEIANAMAEHGIDRRCAIASSRCRGQQDYPEDDFKFNPDGIVRIET